MAGLILSAVWSLIKIESNTLFTYLLITPMKDFLYNPPLMFWILVGLTVAALIFLRLRETLTPLITSIVSALAENAKNNVLLYVLAFSLAMSATSDAVADYFGNVEPADWAKMGWWQIAALFMKAMKPAFATIAALLVNPPAIKAASSTAKELAKAIATPDQTSFPAPIIPVDAKPSTTEIKTT
jgi:Na+/H+ antiporter NhaD/arsenite permease-like protein